jgi:hypothetical protein
MTRFSDTGAKIHFYFKGANGSATEIIEALITNGIIWPLRH